jgi:hypothetical protein
MQTKLTEQQNLVETHKEANELCAKLELLPAANLAPAITDFRRLFQSFLVGFVKMVMPFAHVYCCW